MGKSTNGPDWTDCAAMTIALQALHGCTTSIEFMPALHAGDCVFEVVVISTWQSTVPLKRNPTLVTKHGVLPGEQGAAAARVLGALYEHDAQISEKVYNQSKLDLA